MKHKALRYVHIAVLFHPLADTMKSSDRYELMQLVEAMAGTKFRHMNKAWASEAR